MGHPPIMHIFIKTGNRDQCPDQAGPHVAETLLQIVEMPSRNLLSGSKYDLYDQHQGYTDEK